MLVKLVNYFMPAKLSKDQDNLRTERIFISVLLISALSNLLGINLAFEIGIEYIALLLFTNAAINILLLFLYKYGMSRTAAANLFLFQQAVSFVIQAYLQGGLSAPAPAAFFLLPALAMLILGKRYAIGWVVISVMMTTLFLVYESYAGPLPIRYEPGKQMMFFYFSLVGTNVTIFIILLVYENSKNRALETVQKKHSDLVSAQAQLIQTEKMASLGELTVGIAHEIQNPLNFVNNFSEVGSELIREMVEEVEKGNYEEVKALAADVRINLEKINHHGKRAGDIVKNMLQHSRTSSGQKEPTDINALAGEYLRLAYHGLRAKDKSFDASLKTEFDERTGMIEVIPQDIGRVLLNLINNAFYAVEEKRKSGVPGFEPLVAVSTRRERDKILVTVRDNGNGVPGRVLDKIFQPFFTTKPTGQGTGLGLSLAYDIVKVHGGELKVETREGEGSAFTIQIPVLPS